LVFIRLHKDDALPAHTEAPSGKCDKSEWQFPCHQHFRTIAAGSGGANLLNKRGIYC